MQNNIIQTRLIHNCTSGFPVWRLDVPLERSEGELSLSRLDLAKESYKYLLCPDRKTHEQFTLSPHYADSSKLLCISKEDIDRFQEAFIVYIELPSEELPVVSELTETTDQCWEFCNSRGLISDLQKCLNEAKKNFSNRKSLCAELGYFEDELSTNEGHVVIRLEVASDSQTVSAEYNAWVDWMVDNISPNNVGMFTLTIRRRGNGTS